MKLKALSILEVTESLYDDYCIDCTDDGETPLEQTEWLKLDGVKQHITYIHSLFAKIKEQS
mgnify:FL=1